MNAPASLLSNGAIAAAIAQPLSTQAWRVASALSPETDAARRDSGPVTPADGAFAIWAPLFASSLAHAIVLARTQDAAAIRVQPFSLAAFALNNAWSVNAQAGPLRLRSLALLSGAAASAVTALLRARASPSPATRRSADTIGGLAGWLTVASFAHLETTANALNGRLPRAGEEDRAVALIASAAATASGVAWASRGALPFAAAAGWGLAGVAWRARTERRPSVLAAALLGLGAVAAATALARRR